MGGRGKGTIRQKSGIQGGQCLVKPGFSVFSAQSGIG
jgi:hypothetical protein